MPLLVSRWECAGVSLRSHLGLGLLGWGACTLALLDGARLYLILILWTGPRKQALTQGLMARRPASRSSSGTCHGALPIILVVSHPIFLSSGSPPTKRQRRSRGRPSGGGRRRRRGGPAAPQQQQEPARPASEGKVTCGRCLWALGNARTVPMAGCRARTGGMGTCLGRGIPVNA